ncbi:hypothetical protein D3C81_2236440 [compost metagenome]
MMPELVIDRLEPVQIQVQYGELLALLTAVPEMVHSVRIEQAREAVPVSKLLQLFPLVQHLAPPGEQTDQQDEC